MLGIAWKKLPVWVRRATMVAAGFGIFYTLTLAVPATIERPWILVAPWICLVVALWVATKFRLHKRLTLSTALWMARIAKAGGVILTFWVGIVAMNIGGQHDTNLLRHPLRWLAFVAVIVAIPVIGIRAWRLSRKFLETTDAYRLYQEEETRLYDSFLAEDESSD